ncbi:hypothetical protein PVAND_017330 [Polypedilum vanderplanki]|uniref:BPTI/Kunitz inhibitor domain-containing protein n=1 Tax=Polypedilum vanderplanki TaxID=319348 RepID=A0A9J6BIR4_POLVA|nr:hypothetical protein PVAND_017330 [Polypedilum vanderplanki]
MKFLGIFVVTLIFLLVNFDFTNGGAPIVSGQIDRCLFPFNRGAGVLGSTRYFFNLTSRACEEFTYLGGTLTNIFITKTLCLTQCAAYL